MPVIDQLIYTVLFIIILTGSFLSWTLIFKSKSRNYLGFFVLTFTLITINLILASFTSSYVAFPMLNAFLGYLLTPFLFFHFLSLLKVKSFKKLSKQHIIINLPLLMIIVFWIFDDYRRKILGFDTNNLITSLIGFQCGVYLFLVVIEVVKHKQFIIEIKHTLQYKRVVWALLIFGAHVLITSLIVIKDSISESILLNYIMLTAIFTTLLLLFVIILAKSQRGPSFFTESYKLTIKLKEPSISKNIDLSIEDQNIINNLRVLMNTEKIFKDPNLNLSVLADQLNISSSKLTSIMKEYYNKSYTDLISSYRLMEVKQLLKESEATGSRINEIMYDVGFNSRSTFNTWFKKNTGFTPSEYRKKHNVFNLL